MRHLGDAYLWTVEGWPLVLEFSRLSERRETVSAELTVVNTSSPPQAQVLAHERINLLSSLARKGLAGTLRGRLATIEWNGTLTHILHETVQHWRRQGETITLAGVDWRQRPHWLLAPWIEYGAPTVLFALGGSYKSWLALAMALSVASGRLLLGKSAPAEVGPVLYLDWEADAATHAQRLEALCAPLHLSPPTTLHYRQMARSLADSADTIHAELDRLGAILVIVDSVMPARGGDAIESEPTRILFDCLRRFGRSSLVVDHVPKHADATRERPTPYGNVGTENRGRNLWFLERTPEDVTPSAILLRRTKANNSARVELRRAFQIESEEGIDPAYGAYAKRLAFKGIDPEEIPEFAAKLPLRSRVRHVLLTTGAQTAAEIATALDLPEASVRTTLARLVHSSQAVRLERGRYGAATYE